MAHESMNLNQISHIASLVGEPARTAMLVELMDGRALTAGELARAARIAASTCSRHLALLVEAGLLSQRVQGRHRYHALASPEVARLLENIMQLAGGRAERVRLSVGPRDAALRQARSCYDHLAGRLGVAISDRLLAEGGLVFDGDSGHLSDAGLRQLAALGIDTAPLRGNPAGRAQCRPCLDWSVRRYHVAGRVGAALCSHSLQRQWLKRRADSRALQITPQGQVALQQWLGLALWRSVVEPTES